jgi:predicted TIM-barrel fold metal-dependent hydrolase
MLEFPRIRFALAHIGWPWCEECMAVLGKVRACRRRKDMDPKQMFIDTTPGTPPSRRREIMKMALLLAGEDYLLFGTDNGALGDRSRIVLQRDKKIFASLRTPKRAQNKIFGENAMKFLYGD